MIYPEEVEVEMGEITLVENCVWLSMPWITKPFWEGLPSEDGYERKFEFLVPEEWTE